MEKGKEGGMWEKFWGGAYYMRKDLKDETDRALRYLRTIGYLEPRHTGTQDDIDLVLWLR